MKASELTTRDLKLIDNIANAYGAYIRLKLEGIVDGVDNSSVLSLAEHKIEAAYKELSEEMSSYDIIIPNPLTDGLIK